MSVRTIADEQRDKAVKHVQEALECLNDIVVNRCQGYEDYREDYKRQLRASHAKLIEIRDAL